MRQPSKGSTRRSPRTSYYSVTRTFSLSSSLSPPYHRRTRPPFPSLTIFVSLFLWRRRVPFSLADLAFRRRPFRFFLASASRTRYGKRANSPFVYPASDNDRVSASICPLTVLVEIAVRTPLSFVAVRAISSPSCRVSRREELNDGTRNAADARRLRQREDARTFGPEASALPGVLVQANCRHRTSSPANFIRSSSNETANYPITAARPTAFHRHH